MKRTVIILFALALSVLFAGGAFAETEEFTDVKAGVHYLTFTGDNDDISAYGLSIYGMRDKWLYDFGFSHNFDDDSVYGDIDLETTVYLDGSYVWYSDPEVPYGLFGALGLEVMYADDFLIGVVGQIGYEWENGMELRAKYGLLTEDVQPLYIIFGFSF